MRIENLRLEKTSERVRICASAIWEDSNQENRELFFETTHEFADGFACNPNAFAMAAILPAMFFGEKRLKLEGGICPALREGLITNMNWYRYWHGAKYKPVSIEAKTLNEIFLAGPRRTVGLFLSGGVDSLYSLRINRLCFPVGHPSSVSDCFLVHGFDMYHAESADQKLEMFDRALMSLKSVASNAKVNLIPVYTNIRHLHSDVDFWIRWYFGAALSSVAHAFSGRLHKIILASGASPNEIKPWGSHPVIDPNYSSATLLVWHDYLRDRFEKISLISGWDEALHNMRVCTHNKEGLLNCGRCEKCIRTMTALLILGKLRLSRAFPIKDISPALMRCVTVHDRNRYIRRYYDVFIPKLEEIGRLDLAIVLKKEFGAIGAIRRFDGKFLGGFLVRLWGFFRNSFMKP